jgi:hypothetical protein
MGERELEREREHIWKAKIRRKWMEEEGPNTIYVTQPPPQPIN